MASNSADKKFYTIKEAAGLLGLQYWKLQRAVKARHVPGHALYNKRKYVRLDEIEIAMRRPLDTPPKPDEGQGGE